MEFYSIEMFEIMGDYMDEVRAELEAEAELEADLAYGNPWEDDFELIGVEEVEPSNDWA